MAILDRLFIEITADTGNLEKDLKTASKRLQQFGRDVSALGRTLTVGVTGPLAAFGAAAIKAASDAEEAANKFDVVFGASAASARQELERLAETVPLTSSELQGLSSGVQDLLVPLGLARAEAARFSVQAVSLAGDLASFNNIGAAEALNAIRSALVGESEPIRRLGVDTREAALQTIALEQGLIQQGQALDGATRAAAVFAKITSDSADALGDAARTVDSTANSFKFLARDIRQITINLGQELIPIIRPLVGQLRDITESVKDWDSGTAALAVRVGLLTAALGPVLIIVGSLIQALARIRTALIAIRALLTPGGAVIIGLGLLALKFTEIDDTGERMAETLQNVRRQFRTLGQDALVSTLQQLNASLLTAQARLVELERQAAATQTTGQFGVRRGVADAAVAAQRAEVERLVEIIKEASLAYSTMGDRAEEAAGGVDGVAAASDRAADAARTLADAFRSYRRALAQRQEEISSTFGGRSALQQIRRRAAELLIEQAAAQAVRDTAEATADEFARSVEELRRSQNVLREMAEQDARRLQDAFTQAVTAIGEAFGDLGRSVSRIISQTLEFGTNEAGGLSVGIGNPLAAIGGTFVAAINGIVSSAAAAARRVEQARQDVARALDAYVDELADATRFERDRAAAIEGARAVLQEFADAITAGIKSDKIREALAAQFDDAVASLDLDQLREVLSQFGPEGAAVLAELERRLRAVAEARQAEINSLTNSLEVRRLEALGQDEAAAALRRRIAFEAELAQALELGDPALVALVREVYRLEEAAVQAAEAAAQAAEALRTLGEVGQSVEDRILQNTRSRIRREGGDRALFNFDIQRWADEQRAIVDELVRSGQITAIEAARFYDRINEAVAGALAEFDAAARSAAEAAREAAAAERFRAEQDLRSLEVRLAVAQGRDREAQAIRDQIELLQAIEDGRSAEYIALLQQVQAAERAARARDEEARAAQETERAIRGVTSALNAPNGLRLSLLRYRSLGPTPGIQQLPPSSFIGRQSADTAAPSFTITGGVTITSSGDESGEEILAKIEKAATRIVRAGGADPFSGRVS